MDASPPQPFFKTGSRGLANLGLLLVPAPPFAQAVDEEEEDDHHGGREDRQRDQDRMVGERQDHLPPPCWKPKTPRSLVRRQNGDGRSPTASRCRAQARRTSSENAI